MAKKPGRPTKLTEKTVETLCHAIRLGATYDLACNSAGISYDVFRLWMKRGEKANSGRYFDFFNSIKKAEGEAVEKWLKHVEEAAEDGNWQAAAWKLERRYHSKYGKQVRQKTENIDIDLSDLSNEQLQRLANGDSITDVLSDSSES